VPLGWSTNRGQGEFAPLGFGLPVAAKWVQAATSWLERISSSAVSAGDWLAPETPRIPPCQSGNKNWISMGVGCQGGEARHVGEVIGRILVVEFMFVDRIVRPVRPQGTDDVIAADAGCVPSRSQIGCALVYCSGDGYWASTAASMPAG
jgi:hypothetical protein